MKILREKNPAETLLRNFRYIKRRVYIYDGPHNPWYAGSNGKLKPYGFSIHSCADGATGKVLWLKITEVITIQWFLQVIF